LCQEISGNLAQKTVCKATCCHPLLHPATHYTIHLIVYIYITHSILLYTYTYLHRSYYHGTFVKWVVNLVSLKITAFLIDLMEIRRT
jgi:hypothetical protein